ncbi:MAG: hypothetical protein P0S95_02655 [Rhabdochlamydiaceae bacterium]|nr:hypothetical protein [Candidatus Amphrikana amoebophyrae]
MSSLDDRLNEALEEPKNFSQSLKENKLFFWILTSLAILSIAASYIFFNQKAKKENDFFTFSSLKGNQQVVDEQTILKLKPYGVKYPELKVQIDNLMAKSLMIERHAEKAQPIANSTLSVKSPLSPYYKTFSKTSFIIEQHHFGDALKEAISLKQTMMDDRSLWTNEKINDNFGTQIFLFNLLRIASIYREIGNVSEEFNALKELRAFLGMGSAAKAKLSQEEIAKFQSHLSLGSVSLLDFISSREKVLSH